MSRIFIVQEKILAKIKEEEKRYITRKHSLSWEMRG